MIFPEASRMKQPLGASSKKSRYGLSVSAAESRGQPRAGMPLAATSSDSRFRLGTRRFTMATCLADGRRTRYSLPASAHAGTMLESPPHPPVCFSRYWLPALLHYTPSFENTKCSFGRNGLPAPTPPWDQKLYGNLIPTDTSGASGVTPMPTLVTMDSRSVIA